MWVSECVHVCVCVCVCARARYISVCDQRCRHFPTWEWGHERSLNWSSLALPFSLSLSLSLSLLCVYAFRVFLFFHFFLPFFFLFFPTLFCGKDLVLYYAVLEPLIENHTHAFFSVCVCLWFWNRFVVRVSSFIYRRAKKKKKKWEEDLFFFGHLRKGFWKGVYEYTPYTY